MPCRLPFKKADVSPLFEMESTVFPIGSKALFAGLVFCALGLAPATAQASTLEELANYQGPDRMARLTEGAKKEGIVSVYGSTVAEDMKPLIDTFKSKYGVDIQ